ncbi:MAG TPA: metallophosphoesterase [Pyrinomonadaceae bacterium]|jgi:hypothetical protein
MKIVIIHLSDAHFKDQVNNLDDKGELLARAIQTPIATADACFIVFTGDIAFSGLPSEYNKGYEFLTAIRNKLIVNNKDLSIEFVAIPGNHDCNFKKSTTLRNLSLKSGEALLESLNDNDTSIVDAITVVQDDFFNFLYKLESTENNLINKVTRVDTLKLETGYNRLCYTRNFEINGIKIRFNCFNTAWVSKIREQQGQLVFPDFIQPTEENSNLIFTLFHHPYNWLETTNASKFKKNVEPYSNFILTGHEHESNQYEKTGIFSGNRNLYIEAPVLQDGETTSSGFSILELNIDKSESRITEYSFNETDKIYSEFRQSDWKQIEQGENINSNNFALTSHFLSELNDIGVYIKHPSLNQLTLENIFVCPDLEFLTVQSRNDISKTYGYVESENVLDFLVDTDNVVITGQDTGGRTTLARMLCKHFKSKNLPAVLIQGNNLTNIFEDEFLKTIRRSIIHEYGAHSVESYLQKDLSEKILIIDDFHKSSKLNHSGKKVILDLASKHFGKVIIFADDSFRFEEITQYHENDNYLLAFNQAEIKPFGQRLRRKLISKWFNFGKDYTADEGQIERRVEETAGIVTTLLGRKMMPSYPIFILSMLQILEAGKDLNTAPTNFGYFYEVFILNSLNDNKTKSIPLDVLTTFITLLAYRMYELKRRYLEESEVDTVITEYHQSHAFKLKNDQITKLLIDAKILYIDNYGRFRFKYKMGFYYFVAKYLANNLNSPSKEESVRSNLIKMANNLYVEDYANITIFFVYLTQDERVINQILSNAKRLYEEYKPCNLDSDIEFINKFQIIPPSLQLSDNDPTQNKEEHLREVDEFEREHDISESEDDYEIEKEINDVLRLNVALKNLQIIGQVLRSFPGRLNRSQKLELTQEAYNLGLRTVQMMVSNIEKILPDLRNHLTSYAKENLGTTNEARLSSTVDKIFFQLMFILVYGMIKRISNSVGSEHLKETYEEILGFNNTIPIKFIDTSIRLDHFTPFPEEKLNELNDLVKNNKLCFTVERQMIRDHFHLHKENYKLRQRVCDKFGIQLNNEKLIGNRDKM